MNSVLYHNKKKRVNIFENKKYSVFSDTENYRRIQEILLKSKEKPKLNKQDFYFWDTFIFLNEIDDKLRDLDHSLMFLNSFPNIKTWREKIYRKDYFLYHYECYLSSIIGIFDRLLLLVNYVYDLKLFGIKVSLNNIKKKKKVSKKIENNLEKFNSYLEKIREQRNESSHRNKIKFNELNKIAIAEFNLKYSPTPFSKKGKEFKKKNDKFLEQEIKIFYDDFSKLKKEEIKVQIGEINEKVENILNLIYPLIEEKYNNLAE